MTDEMKDEMFNELLESVREGGAILRGEKAPVRITSPTKGDKMTDILCSDCKHYIDHHVQGMGCLNCDCEETPESLVSTLRTELAALRIELEQVKEDRDYFAIKANFKFHKLKLSAQVDSLEKVLNEIDSIPEELEESDHHSYYDELRYIRHIVSVELKKWEGK